MLKWDNKGWGAFGMMRDIFKTNFPIHLKTQSVCSSIPHARSGDVTLTKAWAENLRNVHYFHKRSCLEVTDYRVRWKDQCSASL